MFAGGRQTSLWLLVSVLCLASGCSRMKSHLSECEVARQQLQTQVEELTQENERLEIEKRSEQHRVAEVEKALARALHPDRYADYADPVANDADRPANWPANDGWKVKSQ